MAIDWFCRIRGQLRGPLSAQDLKGLAASGQLAPDSLVRQGVSGAWVKAARVKGLFQPGAADAGTAKSAAGPAVTAVASDDSVSDFPDFGDDLSSLPTSPPMALPIGRSVAPGVLPVGQVAAPFDEDMLPGVIPGDDLAFDLAATESGRADETRRDRGPGLLRRGLSTARVMSVALLALLFGFTGLCVILKPVLPIILGVVGVILAMRGWSLAVNRDKSVIIVTLSGLLISLGASIGGVAKLLTVDNPTAWVNDFFGGALTGKPTDESVALSEPSVHWQLAPEEVAITGDLRLQVTGAAVARLPGRENAPAGEAEYLMVSVRLENINPRKVDYASWSGTVGGDPPVMRDDLGSNYKQIAIRGLPGQLQHESIYPKAVKVDLLVFERPVEGFRQLELVLPAAAIGDTEPVRFKIPRSMVRMGLSAGAGPAAGVSQPKIREIRSAGEHLEPAVSPTESNRK